MLEQLRHTDKRMVAAVAGLLALGYLWYRRGGGGGGGGEIAPLQPLTSGDFSTFPPGTDEAAPAVNQPYVLPFPKEGGIVILPDQDPIVVQPNQPPVRTPPPAKVPTLSYWGRKWRKNEGAAFKREWELHRRAGKRKQADDARAWRAFLAAHPRLRTFFGFHPGPPPRPPRRERPAAAPAPQPVKGALVATPASPRRALPGGETVTISGARVQMPSRGLRGVRPPQGAKKSRRAGAFG